MDLKMKHISKSFGPNVVLDGVDFEIKSGQIIALLGENGAGKSTLMNILGGVIPKDRGVIELDGEVVEFTTPRESLDRGIAFIHQELNLINDLAIYENLFIGRELKHNRFRLNHQAMIEETATVFERMGLDLDPRALVHSLDASYKQIVEISRALMMNAKLIIMDEPTTSLTDTEIERVFTIMKKLRTEGVGIIFISHKLREVMQICDRFTVLRDGKMVAQGDTQTTTIADIAFHMVGHTIVTTARHKGSQRKEVVLQAKHISDDRHFRDINFTINRGEVVGFTGLLGDGRSILFQTLFGALGSYSGELLFEGKPIHLKSTATAVDHQIGYVPRDRKENGIIKDLSIWENGSLVTLSKRKKHIFLDHRRIADEFAQQRKSLNIKMGKPTDLITSLSGGNQQKVVLAKWLTLNPKVLILDNPTQGVDVGAKEDIYEIILRLAERGITVIVLSSEAQEIIRVCSRAFVMYHGSIMGELHADEMSEGKIMRLATGVEA